MAKRFDGWEDDLEESMAIVPIVVLKITKDDTKRCMRKKVVAGMI